MEKTYSILIQFGDCNPVASTVRAKDGIDAQDKALALNPGARSIRITGVLEVHKPKPPKYKLPPQVKLPTPEVHPLLTDVPHEELSNYVYQASQEEKLEMCQYLRDQGLSKRAIAKQLGMAPTTVRRWIK